MQFNHLKANRRNLARGCAVLMIAGAAAGCSSQSMRFNGVDDVFTSSTNNQRAIINKQNVDQPYPGDTAAPAPVDGTHTQSVSRSSLDPVTAQQLPPPAAPAPARPMRTASAPALAPAPNVDRTTTTGTVAQAKPFKTAEPDAVRNASAAPHATEIVVRDGETLSGLAAHYHVPADAIAKVNGIDPKKGIRTGQKIVIPAYAYSSKAEPRVAEGKPVNAPKQPAPEKVAVLPQ